MWVGRTWRARKHSSQRPQEGPRGGSVVSPKWELKTRRLGRMDSGKEAGWCRSVWPRRATPECLRLVGIGQRTSIVWCVLWASWSDLKAQNWGGQSWPRRPEHSACPPGRADPSPVGEREDTCARGSMGSEAVLLSSSSCAFPPTNTCLTGCVVAGCICGHELIWLQRALFLNVPWGPGCQGAELRLVLNCRIMTQARFQESSLSLPLLLNPAPFHRF